MQSSKYQQAIYDWIQKGKGNAIIQAVAGSGKTTTIVEASKLIPTSKSCIFVAFNAAIAKELRNRLPQNIGAQTLHSLGLSMFTDNTNVRPEVKKDKLEIVISKIFYNNDIKEEEERYWEYLVFLKKIVPLIKATMIKIDFGELNNLALRYGIEQEITDELILLIKQVIDKCKATIDVIDFDDMIWIPIVNNFKVKTFDWVLVDESQDLNKAQFELIKKICNGHTRVIAVGDKFQSVYAFRGADTKSMDNFKEYFTAIEMPLSICYRCPKKVVELAKEIVEQIEANPKADLGIVENIELEKAIDKTQDGDMILCRTNAPLVKMAFKLIREGKKAVVRGRDIGANLVTMINKYKAMNLQDLLDKISRFQRLQEEKITLIERGELDRRKKSSLITLIDQCETVLVIAEQVETIEELKEKINEIFTDEKIGIVCSSIHKAKGLESDIIYILNYDLMPHPMAKTEEELEQEMNIKYVAITRAKKELYIIEGEIK